MSRFATFLIGLGLFLGAGAGLTGCAHPPPQAPGMAPPEVTVSHPLRREVRDYEEYTGRTAAVDSLEVRAQVTGFLEKIHFKEGAEVKKGEVLYRIDPRTYRATLNQAEAQLRLQQAQLKYQEAVYQRDLRLLENHAISEEEVEKDRAARDTARASVNAARAAVEQARLNLGFTRIQSPITGRVGRTLITRGNLVVANQTLLTTVVSLDPMYVYFDVDEQTMLHIRQLMRAGKFRSVRPEAGAFPVVAAETAGLIASPGGQGPLLGLAVLIPGGTLPRVPVFLGLANEKDYPHKGYVDFVNNQVDPSTATLQVRGVFANPKPPIGDRLLSPGMFVRIRVAIGAFYRPLLVISSAIGTDQDLKFVYVLDEQNKVVRRDVELGTDHDGLTVITKGVTSRDRVIVDGLQHVRPGVVVRPRLVPMPVPRKRELARTPPAVLRNPVPPRSNK
jgi:RND family efflux transporter MFP subunit